MDVGTRGDPYAQRLGERLRDVRQQQGLSLHDVAERSGGDLKASVVGAYERGERSVTVTRLRALASFYRVPVAELLPRSTGRSRVPDTGGGVRIDLEGLAAAGPEFAALTRYLGAIQARRGDYNGRVLTVREHDLHTLSAVLGTDVEQLRRQLVDAGIATVRTD